MKTVKEVSELTGISIRTLRYYDEISLLKPAKLTEAGYRLYDKKALEKLRQIIDVYKRQGCECYEKTIYDVSCQFVYYNRNRSVRWYDSQSGGIYDNR